MCRRNAVRRFLSIVSSALALALSPFSPRVRLGRSPASSVRRRPRTPLSLESPRVLENTGVTKGGWGWFGGGGGVERARRHHDRGSARWPAAFAVFLVSRLNTYSRCAGARHTYIDTSYASSIQSRQFWRCAVTVLGRENGESSSVPARRG